MAKKNLILHIPVIHKGFLDFLKEVGEEVSKTYLIGEELQEELSEIKPDIASISAQVAKDLLEKIGFRDISILSKENLDEVKGKEIILVQNEISRNLASRHLKGEKTEWKSAFLRWDKDKVVAEFPVDNVRKSEDPFDLGMIAEAYKEAEKSGDWWRQIGAVLVKDKKIIARSYNQGAPTDNSPYQVGSMRDFFKAGERQELSPTIHAEQKMISEAAKDGLVLKGTSLYITHFPCSLCAKLVAWAGIKKLYFSEGASNLDGQKTLESAGVEIIFIPKK